MDVLSNLLSTRNPKCRTQETSRIEEVLIIRFLWILHHLLTNPVAYPIEVCPILISNTDGRMVQELRVIITVGIDELFQDFSGATILDAQLILAITRRECVNTG